jgi:hypothetical protein
MAVGHALGRIVSFVILTILWIVGFGTYGIIMKIARLFLPKKPPESYWVDPPKEFPESMRYQF